MVKIKINIVKIIQFVVIVSIIVLAATVFIWERNLYKDIRSWNHNNELSDDERIQKLEWYGCFTSEQEVTWRPIFLTTIILTIIVAYIIHQSTGKFTWNMVLVLAISMFLVQYLFRVFRGAHLYSEMCNRIRDHEKL